MIPQFKNPRKMIAILALLGAALLLSGCGGIPVNSYAGLSSDGSNVFLANQSFVWSINPDSAAVNWKFPEKPDQAMSFYSAPVSADGWLYVSSYDNTLHAFNLENTNSANPNPTWVFSEHKGKGRMVGSPAVAEEIVVVPSADEHLYALGARDGMLLWEYETRGSLWASSLIVKGTVYQAGLDHYLYAFNLKTGELIWESDLGGPIVSAPVADEAGVLYTVTLNKEIMAVDGKNGKILWRQATLGNVWATPLIVDDLLYFGSEGKQISILNPADGVVVNQLTVNDSIISSPVQAGDAIVFTTEGGEVIALSKDGKNRLWTATMKGNLYTTPVVVDEQLITSAYKGDQVLTGFTFAGTPVTTWSNFTGK